MNSFSDEEEVESNAVLTMDGWMVLKPVSTPSDPPIGRALELMLQHGIRHLPVVNGGRPVGIISETDALHDCLSLIGRDKKNGSRIKEKTMGEGKKRKKTISRILVPTDFSKGSEAALDYAMALAKPYHADLILAHVIEPFPYHVVEGPTFVDDGARLTLQAQAFLDRLSKRLLKEKLSVATHLTGGIPSREIVYLAEREKADLIVIGTHGRRGLHRFVAGGVAERVVRLAPCPVVTVRSRPAVPKRKSALRASKGAKE